jgi:hypothetical protein
MIHHQWLAFIVNEIARPEPLVEVREFLVVPGDASAVAVLDRAELECRLFVHDLRCEWRHRALILFGQLGYHPRITVRGRGHDGVLPHLLEETIESYVLANDRSVLGGEVLQVHASVIELCRELAAFPFLLE